MERYHAASVQSSRSQTLILRFISSSAIGISAMIENARLFASDSLLYGGAMHGKLALYHPQYGVIPIAVSLLAIIWTTIFLTWIQTYLGADDVEDLALVG